MKERIWLHLVLGCFALCGGALAQDPKVPEMSRLGAFNRPVSYLFDFVPAEASIDAHPFGTRNTDSFLYAQMRTDSGKEYVLIRVVQDKKGTMFVALTDGLPEARIKIPTADVAQGVDAKEGLLFSAPEFRAHFSPTTAAWSEEGVIDLKSCEKHSLGPGMAHLYPDIPQGSTNTRISIYTTQFWQGCGTILGEPVRGMIVLDQNFGMTKYTDTYNPPAGGRACTFFANIFEDGSVEYGDVYADGALVSDGKRELINTRDSRVKFVYDEKGNITGQKWTVGNTKFELIANVPAPGNKPKADQPAARSHLWGKLNRVGDTRKPRVQFAVSEFSYGLLQPGEK